MAPCSRRRSATSPRCTSTTSPPSTASLAPRPSALRSKCVPGSPAASNGSAWLTWRGKAPGPCHAAAQAAKGRVQRTFAEVQKAKAGGDKGEPASPAKGSGALPGTPATSALPGALISDPPTAPCAVGRRRDGLDADVAHRRPGGVAAVGHQGLGRAAAQAADQGAGPQAGPRCARAQVAVAAERAVRWRRRLPVAGGRRSSR